jgi:hypothetical protein
MYFSFVDSIDFYQKREEKKNTPKARKEKEQRRNEKLVAVECDKKCVD